MVEDFVGELGCERGKRGGKWGVGSGSGDCDCMWGCRTMTSD